MQHILVNLFLQINSNCAIRTNDFISAYASVSRNVAVWIRNSDVSRVVTNGMVRALDGGVNQLLKEYALSLRNCRRALCKCRLWN